MLFVSQLTGIIQLTFLSIYTRLTRPPLIGYTRGSRTVFYPARSPMPTYVYRCETCGEKFDRLMTFSQADQSPACPHCGSTETKKQVTAAASSSSSSSASSGGCGTGRGGFS